MENYSSLKSLNWTLHFSWYKPDENDIWNVSLSSFRTRTKASTGYCLILELRPSLWVTGRRKLPPRGLEQCWGNEVSTASAPAQARKDREKIVVVCALHDPNPCLSSDIFQVHALSKQPDPVLVLLQPLENSLILLSCVSPMVISEHFKLISFCLVLNREK